MSGEAIVEGLGQPEGEDAPAGLCTLEDLRDQAFSVLRDSERAFVTPDDVDGYINTAYMDINARLRLRQVLLEDTTDADGKIPYPTDFVEMINLWIGGVAVQVVGDGTFQSWAVPAQSTPFANIVRAFANEFQTYPVQASTDYALEYVGRPTLLVNDTDQPVWITPELCVRLWKYAAAEAKRKEGEAQEAQTYMDEYLEGLPGRPRVQHRMRPAPISLIPEPGPFA